MLAQFPGSEFGTLVSGPRFSNPHVNRQSAVVSGINRRSSGTIVDESEPTRVAMCEHIDSTARFLFCDLPNQFQSMLADHPAMLRIFVRNRPGRAKGERHLLRHVFAFGDIF